jgi:hypothetical protein
MNKLNVYKSTFTFFFFFQKKLNLTKSETKFWKLSGEYRLEVQGSLRRWWHSEKSLGEHVRCGSVVLS